MFADFTLRYATLYGFLLVLTRISFVFVFIPVPGMRQAAEVPKVVASLAITFALYPVWPQVADHEATLGQFMRWIASEAALGLTIGVAVAYIAEAFVLGAQIFGLQAGYSYASTIDPATQSDATVLQAMVQMVAGVLFFVCGLHREIIRIMADSIVRLPPGTFVITDGIGATVRELGAAMFSTGLRLAFPVIALMLLVDISLALLGRINAQLQLLSLAFPVKMLVSMAMLGALMFVMPTLFEQSAEKTLSTITRAVR